MIHYLTRTPTRRYLLEGDQSHPLLVGRLREMAGIGEGEQNGLIRVIVDGADWSVLVAVLSGGRVELVASRDEG